MGNYTGLNTRLKVVSKPVASIDDNYGPYDNVEDALNSIPLALRAVGLTVGIQQNNNIVEYWFQDGITDSHLKEKKPFNTYFTNEYFDTYENGLLVEESSIHEIQNQGVIQLIDSYTKENVNYEETTVWYDGTPMDDTKVDNVIYRKKDNKYYERKFIGEVDVCWFGQEYDQFTFQKALDTCFSTNNKVLNISKKINLNGSSITIPSNLTLHFNGGSIENGSINLNDCYIENQDNSYILKDITINGTLSNEYFTPTWLGAKGDGISDDTDFIYESLKFSQITGTVLLIDSRTYYITSSINKGENITLNIKGLLPNRRGEYAISKYGGFKLPIDTHLFENGQVTGSITNLSICGVRDESVHVFHRCHCKSLVIEYCNISNVGAMFYDSSLHSVSHIINNIFLTCFYFARVVDSNASITDSNIEFNYINGGAEPTNNSCFEWGYYNGSTISNNFIDYYRCIYYPKSNIRQRCQGGLSFGNQYQVFRYFIFPFNSNMSAVEFTSEYDCFNWVDPSTLTKLTTYESLYNNSEHTIEFPPYIGIVAEPHSIHINNAVIQSNVNSYLLYFYGNSGGYSYYKGSFTCNPTLKTNCIMLNTVPVIPGDPNLYYNSGQYSPMNSFTTNICNVVEELPLYQGGWGSIPNGMRVLYNNEFYVATCFKDTSGIKQYKWIKESVDPYANININTTSNRPSNPPNGFQFFDTTLKKPIWYYNKWIDSNGDIAGLKNGSTSDRPILTSSDLGYLYYDTSLKKFIFWNGTSWINLDGTLDSAKKSGLFSEKPGSTDIYIGFGYFCTDKQTTEGAINGIMIYYKGDGVWVDALGRTVS